MEFKVKQPQEFNNIGNEMDLLKPETLWIWETTEVLNYTSDFLSQFIAQETHFSNHPASFEDQFERIIMNSRTEVEQIEPEY